MKFAYLIASLTLMTQFAFAERIQTRISKVIESDDGLNPHLLFLENGQVARIAADEKASLDVFEESQQDGSMLDIEMDERNSLLSVSSLEEKSFLPIEGEGPVPTVEKAPYTPTNLTSAEQVQSIFKLQSRRYQRRSQCYNRAHVWAFEEYKRSGLQSMKLFMFFTKKYIWDYNYDWWFHVTPMTYLNGNGMTLDRMFFKQAVSVKEWTLKFIYSKRDCPVVKKYSDYENYQDSEHCYLIPVSMYYWQPRDIKNFEQTGVEKTEFVRSDVNWAYSEAF